MANIKIFVIAHKECEIPRIKGYYSLLVGATGKENLSGFDYRDNIGKNICEKNSSYCELTGIYWIWKNINTDIIGLCHYRRFFTKSHFSRDKKYYLAYEDMEKLFSECDVIVPERLYYKTSIKNAIRTAPNKKDFEEIYEAIKNISPEYLTTYEEFLSQRSAYFFNMCIMSKQYFDRYCEWIFNILSYIEERHDMSVESGYRLRLFGFLAERLMYVWLSHNIPPERIKEVYVVRTDVKTSYQFIKYIKNRIKKCLAVK